MISNEILQKLFQNAQNDLKEYWQDDSILLETSQFFRGTVPPSWKSSRHCLRFMMVFNTYKIIPEYCFDCYKITIEPRTVIELFKLMIIFERLDLPLPDDKRKKYLLLPDDNIRKCMVEIRPQISGSYKGFIYCQNLEEAQDIFNQARSVISGEISEKVPVALKRGCSEYPLLYPEYAQLDKEGRPVMEYRNEWREYEELAERNNLGAHFESLPDTFNRPGFNMFDARVMLTWLKYAATLGDSTYLKITGRPLPKYKNLKRPLF